MLVAFACSGKMLSSHFGHSESFCLYELNQGEMIPIDQIENPGHRPGFLPVFLSDLGVKTIVAGGMGASAQRLFQNQGIEVIIGHQGLVEDLVEKFAKGELISTEEVCEGHHDDHHHHHDHEDGHHHH